jgi:hypothetical protein
VFSDVSDASAWLCEHLGPIAKATPKEIAATVAALRSK